MKRLIFLLKFIWVAAMLLALSWYMRTHWVSFIEYGRGLGPMAVLLALSFLVLAKFALAQSTVEALRVFGVRVGFWKAFRIYTVSQLGKYIPGSIWHFVGRVLLYRAEGLPAHKGTKVVIVENYWLIVSAIFFGAAACAGEVLSLVGWRGRLSFLELCAISGTIALLWFLALFWGTRLFAQRFGGFDTSVIRIYIIEVFIWIMIGMSFWIILPDDQRTLSNFPLAVGAFALGWAGGFLVPIAPAGIGIREVIVVALIVHVMPTSMLVAAVTLNRLLYTVTDLTLGTFSGALYNLNAYPPEISESSRDCI